MRFTRRGFLAASAAAGQGRPEEAVNSLGMKLVLIQPGSFVMGSEKSGEPDEQPVRRVTIGQPFYMGVTEVTNAQYEQFDPAHRRCRGMGGVSSEDDEAVVQVSWHDAVAFCRWLSRKEKRPYRLPTEAEWEFACRAGSSTPFHTGEELPLAHHRNQPVEGDWEKVKVKADDDLRRKKGAAPVSLTARAMPPNAWGLHEMHGNVEEWCQDWYGSYPASPESDPAGPAAGIFKVSRGGSHNTYVRHLRSAKRHGALPADKHWMIGFRVVQAPASRTRPRPAGPSTLDDASVRPGRKVWPKPSAAPVFIPPTPFVRPAEDPRFAKLHHHHHPAVAWCENGDLLAVWFNTRSEIGREMRILSSRLPEGAGEWTTARLFLKAPDRNMSGSCLLHDGRGRIYFLNGISESSHHRDQCMVLSISGDCGRRWTTPRIVNTPGDRRRFTPMASAFVASDGAIVVAVDINHPSTLGETNGTVFLSRDRGKSWSEQAPDTRKPDVRAGATGSVTAGYHLSVVQLEGSRLLSYSRTGDIGGRMTKNVSLDMGRSWTYTASEFPGLGGGQRLVLMRLIEGPLLFVSFTGQDRKTGLRFQAANGEEYTGYGMFAALSFDGGETWPEKKLLTAGGPPREVDGGGNTGKFLMDDTHAEVAGYLCATQTPDGIIHLLSSRLHYRFNLAWLRQRPAPPR